MRHFKLTSSPPEMVNSLWTTRDQASDLYKLYSQCFTANQVLYLYTSHGPFLINRNCHLQTTVPDLCTLFRYGIVNQIEQKGCQCVLILTNNTCSPDCQGEEGADQEQLQVYVYTVLESYQKMLWCVTYGLDSQSVACVPQGYMTCFLHCVHAVLLRGSLGVSKMKEFGVHKVTYVDLV